MITFTGLLTNSCNDDFLNKNENITTLESEIFISPDWETDYYFVVWQKAGNAKFTVTHSPKWLNLESVTGQFINGVAFLTCSAIRQDDFSTVGFYNAQIQLNVEGIGLCMVRVRYINEGNPTIETSSSMINLGGSSGYRSVLTLFNRSEGILVWKVIEQPEWISLSYDAGVALSNSANHIEVIFQPVSPLLIDTQGTIVIANNSRNSPQYTINVQYTAGTAKFSCNVDMMDFERSIIQQTISIYNSSNGLLMWEIDQCPEWISVSKSSGMSSAFSSDEITMTCNREGLAVGSHTAIITFKSNDKENPNSSITVKCHVGFGNSENITSVDGIVKDVEYDETAGLLYIVTQNPDQLIVYDTQTKTIIHRLNLDLAPTCIGIDENGASAVVGHGGMLSHIDLKNLIVKKYWEINFMVYDVVLIDDWCLLSPEYDYGTLNWLNVETGETQQLLTIISFASMRGKSILRKSQGKNMIIGTLVGISASGIYLIDLQTKMIEKYFSVTIEPFWLSQNGDRIFTGGPHFDGYKWGYGYVYQTPSISIDEASPIAKFETIDDRFNNRWLKWAYHHDASNSLWVIADSFWSTEHYLFRYNAINYKILKQYDYSDYFTTTNGVATVCKTKAHYVFANNSGTEIYLIKNVSDQYKTNAWSIEWMVVN